MIRYCIILIFLSTLFSCKDQEHHVKIQVESNNIDPSSERVYISGNHSKFGFWDPSKIHFDFDEENQKWVGDFKFYSDTTIEFKLTKGSWMTEALTDDEKVRGNFKVRVTKDTSISLEIKHWKNTDILMGVSGNALLHKDMPTKGLASRHVIVRFPPSYEYDADKRFPVLYMHDGQNVFNPYTSYTGNDWRVDEVSDSLFAIDQAEEFIAVAIYNTAKRTNEYSYLTEGQTYASWLVNDLKPFIDSSYRTKTDPSNTAIMGSSMGGLISFILTWEYPEVFGKAACLSPAFDIPKYDLSYLSHVKNDTENLRNIKVYIDNGTEELEKELQPGVDRMMKLLDNKGYNYVWHLDEGAFHNEKAWSKRVHKPLLFLFGEN